MQKKSLRLLLVLSSIIFVFDGFAASKVARKVIIASGFISVPSVFVGFHERGWRKAHQEIVKYNDEIQELEEDRRKWQVTERELSQCTGYLTSKLCEYQNRKTAHYKYALVSRLRHRSSTSIAAIAKDPAK